MFFQTFEKPSQYRITPEANGKKDDPEDKIHSRGRSGHILRSWSRVDYSMAALPKSIATEDKSNVRETVSAPERAQ